jgi:glyoxylase-like metal-dependent hydrolase (beta-lactamase superfamily II)
VTDDSRGFERISDCIFLYRDTCNVYVVKEKDRAVLIDTGSGSVFGCLETIGVRHVDIILHTGHHRDICNGDDSADASTTIMVPASEQYLFSDVEEFWQKRRVYVAYTLDSTHFSRRMNISCKALKDNDTVQWHGYTFIVSDTPGDSRGSISILLVTGSVKALFCGGLISSPGKAYNLYDFQWDYMPAPYKLFSYWIQSLKKVCNISFDLLCPSHGNVMDKGREAAKLLIERASTLQNMMDPQRRGNTTPELTRVLPHLIYVCNTTYLILSENGRGLIVDFGYVNEDYITRLKEEFGLKKLDAITITHYHDDHLCRVPELQHCHSGNRYSDLFLETEVWTIEELADVLENPKGYNLPCLFPSSIPADKVFKSGTAHKWEEYELYFYHQPGQTHYAMGLFVMIDGCRVLFTGDNIWPTADGRLVTPIIFRNVVYPDSLIKAADNMKQLMPELLATGHYGAFRVDNQMLDSYVQWTHKIRDRFYEIVDQEAPLYGIDCKWAYFYPYMCEMVPGHSSKVYLRVRNHSKQDMTFKAELRLPEGFECEETRRCMELGAGAVYDFEFVINMGSHVQPGERYLGAADITRGDKRCGEAVEFIIYAGNKTSFL